MHDVRFQAAGRRMILRLVPLIDAGGTLQGVIAMAIAVGSEAG